jgi:hypothetical protein
MNLSTVLYYSANVEDPVFEKKIQDTILNNCGGLPIISVTHKPTDFGQNICVGEVGVSEMNMLRQILIGCYAATTRYVISAEADCLYPPDYFRFVPSNDTDCYRNDNTYIIGRGRDYFWKKPEGGTWCQVINREFYINHLEELLKGSPEWDVSAKRFVKEKGRKFFDSVKTFTTKNPCISVKTDNGMHKYSHSERVPINSLPYWGDGKEVVKKYL